MSESRSRRGHPVFGLLRGHDLELAEGRVVLARGQVKVGQHEPGGCGIRMRTDILLQRSKLSRVDVNVGIQADQGRPVPPWADREHPIEAQPPLLRTAASR